MSRYIVSPHAQGTDGWLQDRAGRATGSRASDILATIKSGEAAARRDYRLELVVERMTGAPAPQGYVSAEMQWGTEKEPFARMAYEAQTGRLVSESGFAYLPNIMAGCSVDGFIEDSGRIGIWEAKCPKSYTHISYRMGGKVPPAHEPQILHNLWVTGAEFADFVSFDPRFPEPLQLFVVRYERDEKAILDYEAKLFQFLLEVDQQYNQLMELAA